MTTSTHPGFLTLVYETLFHPVRCFETLTKEERSISNQVLLFSVIIVALVSASTPIVQAIWTNGAPSGLFLQTPFKLIFGLLVWLFLVTTVAATAYAFQGKTQLKTFLTLSGLSALPWLFAAPLALAKHSLGDIGHILALGATLFIWVWSVALFGWAFGATYKVPADRILILLLMPFSFTALTVIWLIDFVSNLFQLGS